MTRLGFGGARLVRVPQCPYRIKEEEKEMATEEDWFPRFELGIDRFRWCLGEAMARATPSEMRAAAARAAHCIEKEAVSGGLDMGQISNATATMCTIVRELAIEVENLRTELGKGEEK